MRGLCFRVHRHTGEHVGDCKWLLDAAYLAGAHGNGAQVRYGRGKGVVLWHEGVEAFAVDGRAAADRAADIMSDRLEAFSKASVERRRKAFDAKWAAGQVAC